ncbi:MAG: hypothetical protein LBC29_03960, partial [Propionibacteriaceae bacterium]|nr:hypothetical protein [Propionibacteriaceae bacterium]
MKPRYAVTRSSSSSADKPIVVALFFVFCAFVAALFVAASLSASDSAFGADTDAGTSVSYSYVVEIVVTDSGDTPGGGGSPGDTPGGDSPDDPDTVVSAGGVSVGGFVVVVLCVSAGLAFVSASAMLFVTEKRGLRKSKSGVLAGFLLLAALPLGVLFTVLGSASAAPATDSEPVLVLHLDKAVSLSATGTISIDGKALESRYVAVNAALASDTAGIQSSLANVALSDAAVVVSEIADPTSDGVYPFDFQATVGADVAPGTYQIVLGTTVSDIRKPLSATGVTVADKTYDGDTEA